ncbi:MAG: riboflavin synthase [Bdellovibrionales bacterium]|nr:riboflavin synthase [Bdellovibrionales bacterium]
MFTGIVEERATVQDIAAFSGLHKLEISSGLDLSSTKVGDSICVSGVCLTVTAVSGKTLNFDISAETQRRSNLASLRIGDSVNLERSLKVGERLHGHFVSGHIDATTTLRERSADGMSERFCFDMPCSLAPFIAPKGSITIDGVSLTVGEVQARRFSVYVIPHTAEVTTFANLAEGDLVNLEVDILARYVLQQRSVELQNQEPR